MKEKHQTGILDKRPIEIGGFSFRSRSATPSSDKVKPTAHGWEAAIDFAAATVEASPYWIGDLLNYAETRKDWADKLDQMMSRTGFARHTLHNHAYVARNVEPEQREDAPTYSHAVAVAGLEPKQQTKILKRAKDEELTVSQTRKLAKAVTRPKVVEGQAVLKGRYRVIMSDCPWEYDNDNAMPDGSLTPADDHYKPMTVEELCSLPIEAHALEDAVLFQWSTNAHLPEAIDVGRAWGFEYKTNYVWDKVLGRPGPYGYMHHELLLIFTRGAASPDVPIEKHDHSSIFTERRSGRHSEKPKHARKLITSLYPEGPYLELFGREKVKGWTVFGNDARLWSKASGE